MLNHGRFCPAVLTVVLSCAQAFAGDDAESTAPPEFPAEQIRFFETNIRPLLAENCFKCHGEKEQKGGLRLDLRGGLLAGGESGEVVVPGKPEESLLIEAVNYESYEMPPDGKLSDDKIALLTKWVKMGAPFPGDSSLPARTESSGITDEDRSFWSFQPLTDPAVPEVRNSGWCRNEIDHFILARLEARGIEPAGEAPPATLVRRLHQTLVGLPPTLEETDAFLSDSSEAAYQQRIDALIDSPHYGEHWASFWLDLVRYADSDGYKADFYRERAWRYRDYVIRAFNEDKPYDRFVAEQLAGDEIAPHDPQALAATGYLRCGIYEYNQRDAMGQWRDMLNDITDNVGDTFLAMGMGCARCHDHKFDPLLQRDYYRLQGFFSNISLRDDVPLATQEELEQYERQRAAWEAATADIRAEINDLIADRVNSVTRSAVEKFSPEIQAIFAKPAGERDSYERQIAHLVQLQVDIEVEKIGDGLKGDAKEKWDQLHAALAEFDHLKPKPLPLGRTITDMGPVAPAVFIPGRERMGEIKPGFLSVFDESPAQIVKPESPGTSGLRTTFAAWLTRPDHPLTSRVIVNRIWQQHFGTGLVATTSDFGHLGEPPSHPELLDWLATRFVANGWSIKWLQREIVSSATFRQTSLRPTPSVAITADPQDRWLWRFPLRRMSAEQIRDTMLAVSKELRPHTDGPPASDNAAQRSVYTRVMRNSREPLLDVFDLPDRIAGTGERNVTTTPSQSLLMINGDWSLDRARAFATRVEQEISGGDDSRVRHAYRLAFGRDATPEELATAVQFLFDQREQNNPGSTTGEVRLDTMPVTDARALVIDEDQQSLPVAAPASGADVGSEFSLEATVLLRSLYPDASVRTIVADWDSQTGHSGWSLGVTSTKSRYEPRNLILQLVGDNAAGERTYEVVASGLHLELDRPYRVAVSVRLALTEPAGITFYVRDLSAPEEPWLTAQAAHSVIGGLDNSQSLTVGGRDGSERHRWHGLIDEVAIAPGALDAAELEHGSPASRETTVGLWQFEDEANPLVDSSPNQLDLSPVTANGSVGADSALVDLCHVLLNSNEFIYVD